MVVDDLKVLYPNPQYNNCFCRNKVVIDETDAGARFKQLEWTGSDFQHLDTTMVKDFTSFFQKAQSSDIFNHDCDGILLFEEGGKKYFFLMDMKSGFSTQEVYKAMHQIISSYIKANMLLHPLASYDKKDYIFKAFIACYPPKKDYLPTLNKIFHLPPDNKYKTQGLFAAELYKKKKSEVKGNECEKLKGMNLDDKCLFNTMEFHFVEVPEGQKRFSVDANNYI